MNKELLKNMTLTFLSNRQTIKNEFNEGINE
jgi:hypothetical protein